MIDIKNSLKLFTCIFTMFLLALLVTDTTHASASVSDSLLTKSTVKISVTNNKTGKTKVLNPLETKNAMKVNSIKSDNESVQVGYDVFVPIEAESSGLAATDSKSPGFTTLDTGSGSKKEGGITAKLYVDYDTSANNEKVRLNRLYGSWTPSSNMYYVTNRKADAHSGTGTGKNISKTPTSNNFSYTTGWGYNYRGFGQASPRAWSSAVGHVSGMSTTHTIKVEFTYS